jgi:sirohydrochlorin cobaltochelatase
MLVGHGTRDPQGTGQFFELGQRLAGLVAPQPMVSCLLEFQRPTIAEAWRQLVDQGASHIHVAPLLLFAAGHAKQDIPEALARCQAGTPEVSFDQCRALSRHPAILELACERIAAAAGRASGAVSQSSLVMVGRGSRDPCAQADMRVLAELVARRLGVADVATAFYAMAQPRLAEVLDRVARDSPSASVIVYPHLLFSGRLFEAIGRQVTEAAERYRQVQFRLADYLGPDRRVAEALAARVMQNEPRPTAG